VGAGHTFAARLKAATEDCGTPLCVGIDPHPQLMPGVFGGPDQTPGTAGSLAQLERFCSSVIAAAAGLVPAVKPQAALFEAHGPGGMGVLQRLSLQAREQGLLVIMDAKRGDIGSTARAYAQAWLGAEAAFASDALTVNPYLGLDSLAPFAEQAQASNSGVFILVRTSNPGAADLQLKDSGGTPVYARLASALAQMVTAQIDPICGLSSIGAVVGATGPHEARALRALLPTAPFLIPGYGAQGASAAQAVAGLIKRPGTHTAVGGLVNASRAITHNPAVQAAKSEDAAIRAMRAAVSDAITELRAAI